MPTPNRIDHAELLANLVWVRALAQRLVRDPALAEDVSQSTLALALERPPRERRGPGLRAWLAAVTRSKARELRRSGVRRNARESLAARPEARPSTLDVIERGSTHRAVVDAVMELAEPERSIVLLRYLDGLSAADIARQRGESPAAVRQRLRRALVRLRERLEERFGGTGPLVHALAPLCLHEEALLVPGTGAPVGLTTLAVSGVLVLGVAAASLWPWAPQTTREVLPELAAAATAAGVAPAVEKPPSQEPRVAVETARARVVAGRLLALGPRGLEEPRLPAADVTIFFEGQPRRLAVRTAADGAFRFELEDSPTLDVTLRVPADDGFREVLHRASLPRGSGLEDLVLERVPSGLWLGIVVDPDGRAIPDVSVSASRASPPTSSLGGLGYATPPPAPPEYTRSDQHGRFSFSYPEGLAYPPSGTKAGWLQLESTLPREGALGLVPARIVLVPAVALEVVVHSESSLTVGASVEVRVSAEEPAGRGPLDPREVLVEAGRARFPEVWSGVELVISLDHHPGKRVFSRVVGDELIQDPSLDGEPLVLLPGDPRTLDLAVIDPTPVRGVVVDSRGAPVVNGIVRLLFEESGGPQGRGEVVMPTDAIGAFVCQPRWAHPPERVFLHAVEHPEPLSAAPHRHGEQALLELPGASLGEELVVQLEPPLSLGGRIEHADGRGAAGVVTYQRPELAGVLGLAVSGVAEVVEGRFEISDLLPGAYDLQVFDSREAATARAAEHRSLLGVEAGEASLRWVLPSAPEPAGLRVRGWLDGRRVTVQPFLFPARAGSDASARTPPSALSPAAERGWPDLADAPASLFRPARRGDGVTLEPLVSGDYRLGVRGYDGDEELYPRGLGLVRIEPGEHLLEFEFVRAGDLAGRLIGDTAGLDLRVALRDSSGALVPTRRAPGSVHYDSLAPTGARGDFRLEHAPVGPYDLLAGTREELLAGTPRVVLPVVVRRYGTRVKAPPPTPPPLRWAAMNLVP